MARSTLGSQHQLAVHRGRPTGQFGDGLGNHRKALGELATVATVKRNILSARHGLQAPAIELGLVRPLLARGQVLHKSRAAGLDEGQRRRHKA